MGSFTLTRLVRAGFVMVVAAGVSCSLIHDDLTNEYAGGDGIPSEAGGIIDGADGFADGGLDADGGVDAEQGVPADLIADAIEPESLVHDAEYVYWTEPTQDRVMRAKRDGPPGPAESIFNALDKLHRGNAFGLVLEGNVFFLSLARAQGAIVRIEVGNTPVHLADRVGPRAIATSATHVYWIENDSDAVYRTTKIPGGPIESTCGAATCQPSCADAGACELTALAVTDADVFAADAVGTIHRFTTSSLTPVSCWGSIVPPKSLRSKGVVAFTDNVFWTSDRIWTVPIGVGAPCNPSPVPLGVSDEASALHTAGSMLYWGNASGRVRRRPLSDDASSVVASTPRPGGVRALSVDPSANRVFWASPDGIWRASTPP